MPIFPIDIVRQFLNAMEARDIVKAKEMLAHNFEMTFPGGAVFHELEQLIVWSKSRYKSIGKTFEKFDNMSNEDKSVVYCFGTLSGQGNDGRLFEGIRFVDRFEIVDGKLKSQRVWNDMAEMRSQ